MTDGEGNPSFVPAPGENSAPPHSSTEMHDTDDDRSLYPLLLQPLDRCAGFEDLFNTTDHDADEFQRSHVRHVRCAAVFGTLAVISAIGELSIAASEYHGCLKTVLAFAEAICVGLAFYAAWRGRREHTKEKWLANRHQAELYRQLKFTLLIHPKAWTDAKWLSKELKNIQELRSAESLKEEIRSPVPHQPFEIDTQDLPWADLQQLVEYYVRKRLSPQKAYLANRAQRNEYKDFFLHWSDWLFFSSVTAAGIHFLIFFSFEYVPWLCPLTHRWPRLETWTLSVGLALLLAAAILPVVAAGARTWRSAFEFSRNKSRFEAAYKALDEVESRLIRDTIAGPGDAASHLPPGEMSKSLKVLRELWWSEHILANEHHEWLRLMLETEWYA